MITRKEIWDKKEEFRFKIRNIFTIVQNPVPLCEDDILNFSESCEKLRELIEDLEYSVNSYIGSDEYYKEIQEHEEMFKNDNI